MGRKVMTLFGEPEPERIITYDTKNIKKDNQAIIEEYSDRYSKMKQDYQRVTYGSKLEANGNYLIGAEHIDWTKVKTWIDLGCGCGNFFEYVLDHRQLNITDFDKIKGVEPVQEFVDICKSKKDLKTVEFETDNVVTYPTDEQYDLVTAIGVLQILNIDDVEPVIEKLVNLTKPGGQIFLTTANFDFKHHKRRRIWWSCWAFKQEEMSYLFGERHGCTPVVCQAFDNHGITTCDLESQPKIFVHAYKSK